MKKKFFLVGALSILSGMSFAQSVPQKLNYQAVVRNSTNSLVANQDVSVQISILEGSATGTPLFVENHLVQTNSNGLLTLKIGTGTVVSGSFNLIDWGSNTYFIKTNTDLTGLNDFGASAITSVTELNSVPYALYADKVNADSLDVFTGATGSIGGNKGVVPAPQAGDQSKFLRGDGVWIDIPSGAIYTAGYGLTLTGSSFSVNDLAGDVTGSLGSNSIGANAVTTAKIAPNAVTSAKISDGTIATVDLANASVTTAKIAATGTPNATTFLTGAGTWAIPTASSVTLAGDVTGASGANAIGVNAVTSAKISDGTIATVDLANSAITSAKIADGTIATVDLANASVTTAKIAATGTANATTFLTGAGTWAVPTTSAVTLAGDVTGASGSNTIGANAVTSAKIADGTIATADLANSSVTTAKIAATGTPNATTYLTGAGTWASPTSTNIYSSNGTLSSPRVVTQGANSLSFTSSAVNAFSIDGTTLSVDAANNNVGIGTIAPKSTLDVSGSFGSKIVTMATAGGVVGDVGTVIVGANISLPAADASNVGRIYHLVSNSGTNKVITGSIRDAGTMAVLTSFTLNGTTGSKAITVQSNGSVWWIISKM